MTDGGSTYLYRCWDVYGHLIYVGITDDVARRKRDHARDKHWWPDVARVTVMAFPRRVEALWAEWAVITSCSPTYNKSAVLPTTPDATYTEKVELITIDPTETLWSLIRRWRRIGMAEPADLIVKPAPRQVISNKVRGSHIYDPKPRTPAPEPNPAPLIERTWEQKAQPVAVLVEAEPEPAPSDFDLIVSALDETAAPRDRYYQIVRHAGERGVGGTEITNELRAEGYSTVRQTVQSWLVEDVSAGRFWRAAPGRYCWNPAQS